MSEVRHPSSPEGRIMSAAKVLGIDFRDGRILWDGAEPVGVRLSIGEFEQIAEELNRASRDAGWGL